MTSLPTSRVHGRIIPILAALIAAFVLALPGIAHADATSQMTPAASSVAGTSAAPANTVGTSANAPTSSSTSATNDTSATDDTTTADDGSGGGAAAQPDSASWQ